MSQLPIRWFRLVVVCAGLMLCPLPIFAQYPSSRLLVVSPPGGQRGSTVELSLTKGQDLEQVSEVVFSHPDILAIAKRNPEDGDDPGKIVPNVFVVTIPETVPTGRYEVRAIGRFGVSNPRAFVVSSHKESLEKEPNSTPEQAMPLEINQILNATSGEKTDVDCYVVQAEAGQRLLIQCWAERIDSKIDATLQLYNPKGDYVASSRNHDGLDPLIDYTIPTSGRYVVKAYDLLYRNGPEYFYRLQVSTDPHIEFVFPPSIEPGRKTLVTVYGRNLPGSKIEEAVRVNGQPLEAMTVEVEMPLELDPTSEAKKSWRRRPHQIGLHALTFDLQPGESSGASSRFSLARATAPVIAEKESNDQPDQAQVVELPCELVGQFASARDRDWFQFDAKKGEAYTLEVYSHRLGFPTNPTVSLVRLIPGENGETTVKEVKTVDGGHKNLGDRLFDTTTYDPVTQLTIPEDGTYRLGLRDALGDGRGSPRFVYRLAIRPVEPDYQLVAMAYRLQHNEKNDKNADRYEPGTPTLRRGGTAWLRVMALRADGFNGPVELSAWDLPEGVTFPPKVLPSGADSADLLIYASPEAKAWSGPIRIVGEAKVGDLELEREALAATVAWGENKKQGQPGPVISRFSQRLMLSVLDQESVPCGLSPNSEAPNEMARGGKLEIPIKVTRQEGVANDIAIAAIGLPKQIKSKTITVKKDQSEGTFTLEFQKDAPVGSLKFHFHSTTQVSYQRNPELVAAANRAKDEAEKKAKAAADRAQKAVAEKQEAEKIAAEADAQLKKAVDSANQAQKAYDQSDQKLKAALEKLLEATKKSQEKGGEDALAEINTSAQAIKDATSEKVSTGKARKQALAVQEREKASAQEAGKRREQATKTADAAEKQAEKAEEAKNAAIKKAEETSKANQAKSLYVDLYSRPVAIRVTAAPLRMELASTTIQLSAGDKLEFPVSVSRLYGFEDEVQLELKLPDSLKGLKAAQTKIDKGQSQTNLTLESDKAITAGRHRATLLAKLKFGGKSLQVEQDIEIVIAAAG